MAATQSSVNGLLMNSGALTTVSTGYMLKSRPFQLMQRAPIHAKIRARQIRQANSVQEIGFFDATTATGSNTAAAVFQCAPDGTVRPVVVFNGSASDLSDISALLNAANFYIFDVVKDDEEIVFLVQNSATEEIISRQTFRLPLTAARLFSQVQVSAGARIYNTGTAPSAAPQLFLSDFYVAGLDQNQNKSWAHQQVSNERTLGWHPQTGAGLNNYFNSAEPANATLSNTTSAYANMHGRFQFAAVAGASTDYLLYAQQMPANAMVTGISIDLWNIGAVSATTPTLINWFLGVASAASLAGGGYRQTVGSQSIPVGTPIGGNVPSINVRFGTPIPVQSGRFFQTAFRMPVGTATASQIIAGSTSLEGYWD